MFLMRHLQGKGDKAIPECAENGGRAHAKKNGTGTRVERNTENELDRTKWKIEVQSHSGEPR